MKQLITLTLIIALYGSNSSSENGYRTDSVKVVAKNAMQKASTTANDTGLTKKVIGVWTGGESENATFQMKADSIYYVEHLESYKYTLTGSDIQINYPDFTYKGKIRFIKDTLVMTSDGDTAKFWKFTQ